MEYSKVQIDARVALRQKTPRNRRVLPATDALRYRYESRQFFSLDFEIFIDLFAGLSRQQLSRVARAPEVITKDEHAANFDDFWPLLYQQGRKEKPRWAALCLVEAAQHVLSQTLQAESNPPIDIINQFADNVKSLKNTLCAPEFNARTQKNKPADQVNSPLEPLPDWHDPAKSQKRQKIQADIKREGGFLRQSARAGSTRPHAWWLNGPPEPEVRRTPPAFPSRQCGRVALNARVPEAAAPEAAALSNTEVLTTSSPAAKSLLDVNEFALAETIDPIHLTAPQPCIVPGSDRASSRSYLPVQHEDIVITFSTGGVGVSGAVEDATRHPQGSFGRDPEMHSRSTVTSGGTTMSIPSVTRTDVPCISGTTIVSEPVSPWIAGAPWPNPRV
ncbi:hypothetical protein Purlil1_13656 [Purpureocillium lilacinum]|uniref:Uncharacterized protein n=1 Tax=Purpureocillium lilacinum TaxID=33203 RepID=A0ABR0BDF8_PURLI|nr:hypothetical protein Purlil1_13656 [Purpureocillium lilacinum]